MEASLLIVSKNRSAELHRTLGILQKSVDLDRHEIMVLLDGSTDDSEKLIALYPEVKWEISEETLGASKARSILYKKATGGILFGFDDDAHPLQKDFIKISQKIFTADSKVGIIAFKEIKGIFNSDAEIHKEFKEEKEDYLVKDFLGCGFAIKKEVYEKTNGFPPWIDIYGEEACVAMEVLKSGYDILFTHQILVNHRTQKQRQNTGGANYFRFQRQLKNTTYFYLVYYPFPLLIKKILMLYFHNFRKYAIRDRQFFRAFFWAIKEVLMNKNKIMKYREPVTKEEIQRINRLRNPPY